MQPLLRFAAPEGEEDGVSASPYGPTWAASTAATVGGKVSTLKFCSVLGRHRGLAGIGQQHRLSTIEGLNSL